MGLKLFPIFLYYLFICAGHAEGDGEALVEAPLDEGEDGGVAVLPGHP